MHSVAEVNWLREEDRKVRREICASCEANEKNIHCRDCGCFLIHITKIADIGCPRNKWPIIDLNSR